ncbi:Phosphorylated CTD interacting factor 1 WW domain [Carpediemonas membranifera]|uniref:Phosphorylated CTD interacting factor 1 WW domain n=1 Tax=Carpediemonas membranifera TaxID=201153 RepID=A0A8J6ATM5_9EUKA|nr:Phosphorylated CTD interacting factor 1 WW domain [Carpediemonas membranifera]|eukprot:KAG9394291.1 Phosphorylated CTD interacting factor 1 WW domain [Carpediemonas membranifera]
MGRHGRNDGKRRDTPYRERNRPIVNPWNFLLDCKTLCPADSPVDSSAEAIQSSIDEVDRLMPTVAEEIWRADIVLKLRDEYVKICTDQLHTRPRKESFNRWLFEMVAETPKSSADPVLRCPEVLVSSSVLETDLYEAFPIPLTTLFDNVGHLRQFAAEYKKAVSDWTDHGKASEDVPAALAAMDKTLEPDRPDVTAFVEACKTVRATLRPVFDSAMRSIHSHLIQTTEAQLGTRPQRQEGDSTAAVTITEGRDDCAVDHGNKRLHIGKLHLSKLKELYTRHCTADADLVHFNRAVFVLLLRYNTFFGPSRFQGRAFHAAAPEAVFEHLVTAFGVGMELFASPTNCYFSHYCSAFPDIDVFFGSRGSAFDLVITSGSYEANPPFTLEVMDRTADLVNAQLERAEQAGVPLSFVVFVPVWKDPDFPIPHYHQALETSKFLRAQNVTPAGDYAFISGGQFDSRSRYWRCTHATATYVLQNKQGKVFGGSDEDVQNKVKEIDQILRNQVR